LFSLELAYSEERELRPWAKVKTVQPKRVKEEEVRFIVDKVDLAYVPVPLLPQLGEISVLSNGAVFAKGMSLSRLRDGKRLLVPSSHSTHYYLARILTNERWIPTQDEALADARVQEEEGDLSAMWRAKCGDLPIPIKVVVTTRLEQRMALEVKVELRRSASALELEDPLTKEMGLRGRKALQCMLDLCAPLCGRANFILL